MPLIGTFTFYLRRRAQVKTRTVSNQLLNGQQVPIIWFRFLVQANSDIFPFSENISKSNDRWVKQLPTWSLEISFTGKNSDNFSYFRKHQWIDFFIIIHIIINKVDAEFSLKLQLTLSRGLNFPSILFTYHPWAVVNTIVEGSQNSVFCWKLQNWWEFQPEAKFTLRQRLGFSFIYHQLSGFLSNYNKQ